MVSDTQSWLSLGLEKVRPIPDGLAKLDLGAATGTVLARLVSAGHGSVVQKIGVEQRPTGDHRLIQFTARFVTGDGVVDEGHESRLVRGLSVDLGPSDSARHVDRLAANLGDRIAQSLSEPHEYRAIVDPNSLRLLYWYGCAPADIAWEQRHLTGTNRILHPDDVCTARDAAQNLMSSPFGTTRTLRLRFQTHGIGYRSVDVAARLIELDNEAHAFLVTLSMQGTR